MKKFALLLMSLLVLTTACAPQTAPSNQGSAPSGETPAAAAPSAPAAPDKSQWPKAITIASSSAGGTWGVWATGWAKLVNDKVGVKGAVEATGGPVNNMQLLEQNDVDFGIVTTGIAFEGYNGTGWSEGTKYTNLRVILPMFTSYQHFWAFPNSGITKVEDLNGKAITTGPKGTTSDTYTRRALEELGIKPSRIVNVSFADGANLMQDGQLDAMTTISGVPMPTAQEMAVSKKAVIFGLSAEQAQEIADKFGLSTAELPANTYPGQTTAISTVTIWNAMTVRKDLPADFVYEVVKQTMENQEEMKQVMANASEMVPEAVLNVLAAPLHPGAIRYYEEKGIKLPQKAYPPEYKK